MTGIKVTRKDKAFLPVAGHGGRGQILAQGGGRPRPLDLKVFQQVRVGQVGEAELVVGSPGLGVQLNLAVHHVDDDHPLLISRLDINLSMCVDHQKLKYLNLTLIVMLIF